MTVRVLTDSEPNLESIASTKQIERKGLRMTVQEMKEKLRDGEIKSYQWVSTKQIWAGGLTKEMAMTEGLRKLLKEGKCEMVTKDKNKVICENEEIKMMNIRNRKTGGHVIAKGRENPLTGVIKTEVVQYKLTWETEKMEGQIIVKGREYPLTGEIGSVQY